jgi:predicted amidohydrolase YtcJ
LFVSWYAFAVLFLDRARVYSYDAASKRFRRSSNVLIDDAGRIAGCDVDPSGLGVERIDLDGATVVPAFIDCHVHLAQTGATSGPRSLAQARSYEQFERAVAALPSEHGVVYGGGYDDARFADGRAADARVLQRMHGERFAMVVRVDGHSSIVNRKTLESFAFDAGVQGIERGEDGAPTGRLFLDANWRAQTLFSERTPETVRRSYERFAADLARSHGVARAHAQLIGGTRESYARDVEFLRTLPIHVHPKICEPDASIAAAFGLPYVGGDVFLDGSLGSCTAAVLEPYRSDRGNGALRFSDDVVENYVRGAEERGISAGVHAIGDAAIDQFIRAVERVLRGKPSNAGTHHFIEHFEMPSREHIDACARMQLHLSMQPQFQATWGGKGGMYDNRVGEERRTRMNPLRAILDAGALVCAGSDSPVCALDPLAGMHAACTAQEPDQCVNAHEALALYTLNAAAFSGLAGTAGDIAIGMQADLAVLDADPLGGVPFGECRVLRTMIAGAG